MPKGEVFSPWQNTDSNQPLQQSNTRTGRRETAEIKRFLIAINHHIFIITSSWPNTVTPVGSAALSGNKNNVNVIEIWLDLYNLQYHSNVCIMKVWAEIIRQSALCLRALLFSRNTTFKKPAPKPQVFCFLFPVGISWWNCSVFYSSVISPTEWEIIPFCFFLSS